MCFCRNSFPARRMLFAKMRQTGISSPSTSATSANSWIMERKCKETRISVSRRAHASLRHSFNGRARVRDSSSRYSLNFGIVSRSCSFKAFTLYKAKGINDDFFRCYCLLCIDFPSCWVFFETRLLRVAFWTRFGGTSDSSLLVWLLHWLQVSRELSLSTAEMNRGPVHIVCNDVVDSVQWKGSCKQNKSVRIHHSAKEQFVVHILKFSEYPINVLFTSNAAIFICWEIGKLFESSL